MTTHRARPVRYLHHDAAERPFIVIWEVTRACQLVCTHCRADAIRFRNPLELTTEQGKKLLDELASFGAPRPLVVLTGGDPFERPDLPELVAHGTSVGLSMALSPSVTARLTKQILVELHDAGAKAVSLSLDGATAATHDAFRGVTGVFDDTIIAARMITDVGYRLQINTTVTRATVGELPEILKTVLALGTTLWSVFFLVPTGRGKLLNAVTPEEAEEVLHWLHDVSDLVAIKTTEAPHYRRVAIQRDAAIALGRAADAARRAGAASDTKTIRTGATDGTATIRTDAEILDEAFPVGPLRAELRAATLAALTGDEPRRRSARAPIDVNSGKGFAFVDHTGDVYPSGFLPVAVGSVKKTTFPELYREAPLLKQLRDPSLFGGRCGTCEFKNVCGGSRSHAFAVTGDPLAEDPSCAWQPDSGSELVASGAQRG